MWEIRKVQILELEKYLQDNPLHINSIIPITPERIRSYLNNPRAEKEDYSLYLIIHKNKIIAFRTFWADKIETQTGDIRFAWCSGNWVSPNFRRRGLSLLLLKEAYNDWNGKLMFTNYAKESEAGYMKSGLFKYKKERIGKRFYYNLNLRTFLNDRNQKLLTKISLPIINHIYQCIIILKRSIFIPHAIKGYQISEVEEFRAENIKIPDNIFHRGENELKWIFDYPWITNEEKDIERYPFSWQLGNFKYRFVTIQNENEKIASIIISNRNGMVKVLYWYCSEKNINLLANWLISYCYSSKAIALTIIDNKLAMQVSRNRKPFVWSKSYAMHIYSTFSFETGSNYFFDGDGDYIFT